MLRSIAAFALAAAVVTGCGGDDDVAEDATATTVATAQAPVAPAAIPEGFPSEVPLPAAIELAEFNEMVGGSTTIYDITGWNAGRPVPLGEAYLSTLTEAGFEVTSRSDAADSIYFVVVNDEWFVSAGFYPDRQREAGTSIGVTVGPASATPAD